MIGLAEINSVARLLEAGHRASPTLDTLLEILKMITRKFTANPPTATNQQLGLSDELENIARAYTDPYVLPHGKHAAVAMNAVQALVASASPNAGILDFSMSQPVYVLLSALYRSVLRRWTVCYTLETHTAATFEEVRMTAH